MAGINGDLFHEFTAHALLVTAVVGEKAVILLGDVAADADGIEAVQAGFLAALAAAVTEDLAVADEEDVGDKLLVTLVLFGVAAVEVHQVRSGGENGEVFGDIQGEALKQAQLFEEFPLKTKHSF